MPTTGFTEKAFENPIAEPGLPSARRPYSGRRLSPTEAAIEFFSQYARERPEVVAMWAFGIGFVLGWKLKPW